MVFWHMIFLEVILKKYFALIGLAVIVVIAVAVSMPDSAKPPAATPSVEAPHTKDGEGASVLPPGHPPIGTAPAVDLENIKIPKASGQNARTVVEVITNRVELKDQTVSVRGKVVKFTPDILDKNWIHLRDGTGSASDNTNDVLVTTNDNAKVGDVVVVKGVVRNDKDFGSGYLYKVLIEEAILSK